MLEESGFLPLEEEKKLIVATIYREKYRHIYHNKKVMNYFWQGYRKYDTGIFKRTIIVSLFLVISVFTYLIVDSIIKRSDPYFSIIILSSSISDTLPSTLE